MSIQTKSGTNIAKVARKRLFDDSTSTKLSDADFLIHINVVLPRLIMFIFTASGDWQVKGDYGVASITAGNNEYSWPSDLLRLNRVEIKYPSSASSKQLATQIDHHSIGVSLEEYTTSKPQYDVFGNIMFIFVSAKKASIEAVTNGIKAYFEVNHDEITALADEISGITYPCIGLLGKMVAKEEALSKQWYKLAQAIDQEIKEELFNVQEYYAGKSSAKKLGMRFRKEDYGQNALKSYGSGGSIPSIQIDN